MKLNCLPYLFLLVIFHGCTTNDRVMSIQEKSRIEQDIRQTMVAYFQDVKQYGLNTEFRYLDSSAEFYWVPPGATVAYGYDTIRTMIEHNAVKFKSVDNSWDSLHLIVLDQEHVIYTGQLNSNMTDTSGEVSKVKMVESGVLIKRQSGWKLLGGQTAIIP
ncbi:MAG: nuclear transport factor 2 family protein [Saprospiraceae bacterium]